MGRQTTDEPAGGRDASAERAIAVADFKQKIGDLCAVAHRIHDKLTQDWRHQFAEELKAVIAFLEQPTDSATPQTKSAQNQELQAKLDLFRRALRPDSKSSSDREAPSATLPAAQSDAAPKSLDVTIETREYTEQATTMELVLLPPEKDKDIAALFAGLSDEPRARLEAIPALYSAIRKQAAKDLQPAVATLVKQAATLPYDQMVVFSNIITQALSAAQVAIRDPETGFPASLLPSRPRPTSATRWLRLRDHWRGPEGGRNIVRLDKLPPGSTIELIPIPPETESIRGAEARPKPGHASDR